MTFPPPDDKLLFDSSDMFDHRPEVVDRLLDEYPREFRAQLAAAAWLDWWAERCVAQKWVAMPEWASSDYGKGFVAAVEHIAAYLRQGYLMPGGAFYDEMFGT